MNAYYFGCWSPALCGHYLFDEAGHHADERRVPGLPIRPTLLDGGLLFGVPDKEGNAVLFHGRGCTLLSFWDRSGDRRGASNSSFILPGRLQFGLAVETAKAAFPQRWSLIEFAVTEYLESKHGD